MMVALGIVLAIIIFSIISLNALSVKRNQTDFAFSTIDVLLKKRYDLVPNLVETVRGYAAHEQKLYGHIAEMRSQALRNRTNLGRRFQAEKELSQDVAQIFILSENYPELRADSYFRELQVQLIAIENELAAARRFFNSSVNEYNNAIEVFPSSVFASLMGLEEKPYFNAEVSERSNPSFKLDVEEESIYA